MQVGWVKIGDFRQITGYIWKRYKIHAWFILELNRKSYARYRMVTLLMTLNDPKVPQTTPICTFCTASHIVVMGAVRNFKSGLYVNGSKSQPADDKSSLKWAWSGRVIHFRILQYFWNDNSSRLQILYTSWPREVLSFSWLTVPEVGMVRITWHILDFFTPFEVSLQRLQLETSNFVY